MQKNKSIHPDIKAVCNSSAKKLIAMGLAVAAGVSSVGSNYKINIAEAQNFSAGDNGKQEMKETPEGDENKTDGDMPRNDDENKTDEDMPHNEEKEYLRIQTSFDGYKYVDIPAGVTALLEDDDAIADVGEDSYAVIHDGATARAGAGSNIVLAHTARIILPDGRTYVFSAPDKFLEVTSQNLSSIGNQEPFRLTRSLPVSPCPAPPHPALDGNDSVSTKSFLQFLQALPKWIEEVAKTFKFNSDTAIELTERAFFNAAMKKGKK